MFTMALTRENIVNDNVFFKQTNYNKNHMSTWMKLFKSTAMLLEWRLGLKYLSQNI